MQMVWDIESFFGVVVGAMTVQHGSVFFNVVKDRKQNGYNMTTAT